MSVCIIVSIVDILVVVCYLLPILKLSRRLEHRCVRAYEKIISTCQDNPKGHCSGRKKEAE